MELQIRSRNLELDADLRDLIRRRMTCALERFDDHIRTLRVLVSDVNGPRGGHDKHVRAELQLHHGESVLVEEQHSDVRAAAATAADRVGQVLGRLVNRRAAARRRRHTVRGGGTP
jgi:ribosomal subunit interface protein